MNKIHEAEYVNIPFVMHLVTQGHLSSTLFVNSQRQPLVFFISFLSAFFFSPGRSPEQPTLTCLSMVGEWMVANQLEISPEKTEAVLQRGKRARDNIFWSVGETIVRPVRSVKY